MADYLIDEGKNKIEGLNKTAINEALQALNTALNSKADAQAVANAFESVNQALNGKASTQALNEAVQNINTALNDKVSKNELEQEVEEVLPEAMGNNYYNKTQTDEKIGAIIDDTTPANNKTFSSEKVESLIDNLYPIENVSGLIANFSTSLARPLVSVKVNIGYNANGVNIVNIYKRGANLFDEQMEKGTYNTANGEKTVSNANLRTKNKIKVKPNTTVCFVTDYSSTSVVGILFRYGIDGAYLGYNSFYGGAFPYTIPNDTYEIAFYTASGYGTTYTGISVNYPASDTIYHQYNGSDLAIDVSGHSLYGGYIEITPESAKLISNKNADGTDKTPEVFDLSEVGDIYANFGVNNIFTDNNNLISCYYYVFDKESKDRKDRQALKFVYVSPIGSNDNDGLTPETPVSTFAKAFTIGKKVRAYRGTYNENVYLVNIDDFSIEPYDNDDTYSTANPKRTKIVINGNANADCVFRIDNCNNIYFEDISFNTAKKSVVRIYDCNNVVMNNCEANGAIELMGFEVSDSDVIFNNCYASQNRYDGFNFHGYGTTILNDCVSENNQDDGCSHHEGCIGTINGGRFSNNGKAGIAPAYGAQVNIYNAVCNNNSYYGIAYLSDNSGHANMNGIINSCLLLGNSIGLKVEPLCTVISVNSKYSGNSTDKAITGTLNEY